MTHNKAFGRYRLARSRWLSRPSISALQSRRTRPSPITANRDKERSHPAIRTPTPSTR